MAWDSLAPSIRDHIKDLIAVDGRAAFAGACAKALEEDDDTRIPHVLDLASDRPPGAGLDLERDCPRPTSCVVREVERLTDILRATVPDREKADAIPRLGHLLADLHHPLNIGFAQDRHGAEISAYFLEKQTTLRELWDDILLQDLADPITPDGLLKMYGLLFSTGGRLDRWTDGDPLSWATETFWIMRTPATGYLGNPGGLVFDDLFVRQNQLVALEQLDKAAVRFAHILNETLR